MHCVARHERTREDKRDPEFSGSLASACLIRNLTKFSITDVSHDWFADCADPLQKEKWKLMEAWSDFPYWTFKKKKGQFQKKTSLARKNLLNPSTKPRTQDELSQVKNFTFRLSHDCSRLLTTAHVSQKFIQGLWICWAGPQSRHLQSCLSDLAQTEIYISNKSKHVCFSKICIPRAPLIHILRFSHNHMPIVSGDVFLPMENTCAFGCLTSTSRLDWQMQYEDVPTISFKWKPNDYMILNAWRAYRSYSDATEGFAKRVTEGRSVIKRTEERSITEHDETFVSPRRALRRKLFLHAVCFACFVEIWGKTCRTSNLCGLTCLCRP